MQETESNGTFEYQEQSTYMYQKINHNKKDCSCWWYSRTYLERPAPLAIQMWSLKTEVVFGDRFN